MGLIQALKKFNKSLNQLSSQSSERPIGRDSSGIALFMVLSSIAVLAILVTEFTYIAQINQAISFGSLDQMKAHYLAKSGLKLSLLRIKAFQQVKNISNKAGGALPGGTSVIPKKILQQIWSFPFFYPIPTVGLNTIDKESVEKFLKKTGLEGQFSAVIESESNKYNLNSLLSGYSPSSSPTPSAPNPNSSPTPNPSASPTPAFNAQTARESLASYLNSIWTQKLESEPEFASVHDDFKLDDMVDQIAGWVDRGYEPTSPGSRSDILMKKAPFYTATELHLLPAIDDDIYNLFIPHVTSRLSSSININTMNESVLRSLVPNITPDEVTAFFTFRDSDEDDNQFKSDEDFYAYLSKSISGYNNTQAITDLKKNLAGRNIVLVTDETEFRITVKAQVNQSTKTFIVWVSLGSSPKSSTSPANQTTQQPPANGQSSTDPAAAAKDPGLRITYMRIF